VRERERRLRSARARMSRADPRSSTLALARSDGIGTIHLMSPSILVVDDDRDIREAIAEILREEGFDVREACDGQQALARLAEGKPDVMLLDLMMPVMSGWQVLQQVRGSEHYADLPIVVLSALDAPGCRDFIRKPVSLDRLLELIETLRAKALGAA
jgi:CheY-like chemotaxis protein